MGYKVSSIERYSDGAKGFDRFELWPERCISIGWPSSLRFLSCGEVEMSVEGEDLEHNISQNTPNLWER